MATRLSGRCKAGALALALVLAGSPSHAHDENATLDDLIAELRSSDAKERAHAAVQIRDRGTDPRAVAPLIRAAKFEPDHGALIEMLLALGESGVVEALGVIQLHAQSPANDLRTHAGHALERWLRKNRVLDEDAEVPEPPHAFYGRPPRFPPDRPAGHALVTHISRPGAVKLEEPTDPAPYYDAPPPGGVPPGFHFEPRPRKGLVIGGSVVFGVLYTATSIPGTIFLIHEPGFWSLLVVPGVGPIIVGAPMLGGLGIIVGLPLVLDGLAQLAGLGMIIGGLSAREQKLVPNPMPELSVSPNGAQLSWSF
jgi:hypothetical protein